MAPTLPVLFAPAQVLPFPTSSDILYVQEQYVGGLKVALIFPTSWALSAVLSIVRATLHPEERARLLPLREEEVPSALAVRFDQAQVCTNYTSKSYLPCTASRFHREALNTSSRLCPSLPFSYYVVLSCTSARVALQTTSTVTWSYNCRRNSISSHRDPNAQSIPGH